VLGGLDKGWEWDGVGELCVDSRLFERYFINGEGKGMEELCVGSRLC